MKNMKPHKRVTQKLKIAATHSTKKIAKYERQLANKRQNAA